MPKNSLTFAQKDQEYRVIFRLDAAAGCRQSRSLRQKEEEEEEEEEEKEEADEV